MHGHAGAILPSACGKRLHTVRVVWRLDRADVQSYRTEGYVQLASS
jgi:hypothetical protein